MHPRHPLKALIFCNILALLIGWVDWKSGYQVSMVTFYALPIVLAVWWVGAPGGFLMAFLSGLICYWANKPHVPEAIALWNGLMRLLTFILFYFGAMAVRFKFETLRNRVKALTGILPVCNCCKKIRDGEGYWNDLEAYLNEHSGVDVARKLCPDCSRRLSAGKMHGPIVSKAGAAAGGGLAAP